MKQYKQTLDSEEQSILEAFEYGKLKSVRNVKAEKKRIQDIAKLHGIKNRREYLTGQFHGVTKK